MSRKSTKICFATGRDPNVCLHILLLLRHCLPPRQDVSLYKGQPFGPRFRRGPSWVGNLKGRNYMHFTQSLPWFSLFQSFPYFLSFLASNLRILESICSQKFNFHVFDFSNHIWTRQHALKQSSLFFAFFGFSFVSRGSLLYPPAHRLGWSEGARGPFYCFFLMWIIRFNVDLSPPSEPLRI